MFVKKLMIPVMLLALVIGGFGAANYAGADDDDYRRGGRFEREHDDDDRYERGGTPLPENALYKEECSSCHFLYTPWLLSAASWKRVINESEDHFGDDLALSDATKTELLAYLTANSTENTGVRNEWVGKRAKLLRGVDMSNPPKRITDLKYIKKEHRNVIKKRIYERSTIKTLSNCSACHRTANVGDFEEDNIKIPK